MTTPNKNEITPEMLTATHNPWDWFATIQGGSGPDVWDKDLKLYAVDFWDAAKQAQARAEEYGGQVVQLELWYAGSPREKTISQLTAELQTLRQQVEELRRERSEKP